MLFPRRHQTLGLNSELNPEERKLVDRKATIAALKITLMYALLAGLSILVPDPSTRWSGVGETGVLELKLVKDLGFVFVTSTLLCLGVHQHHSAVLRAQALLLRARREIVDRLARAVEFRDDQTGRHITRVSLYCGLLGRAYGLSEEDCELLELASKLHDVGKIAIPDSILLKPGRLDDGQRDVMRTHTTVGAKILTESPTPLVRMAETIALTHHERWDGSGYPNGLKQTEIPLAGRIAAVTDVFDALTSRRSYKESITNIDALEVIHLEKGKQFDPNLVDLLELHLPQFIAIRSAYGEPDLDDAESSVAA